MEKPKIVRRKFFMVGTPYEFGHVTYDNGVIVRYTRASEDAKLVMPPVEVGKDAGPKK
jgi:hypothetical protein